MGKILALVIFSSFAPYCHLEPTAIKGSWGFLRAKVQVVKCLSIVQKLRRHVFSNKPFRDRDNRFAPARLWRVGIQCL